MASHIGGKNFFQKGSSGYGLTNRTGSAEPIQESDPSSTTGTHPRTAVSLSIHERITRTLLSSKAHVRENIVEVKGVWKR